MERNQRLKTAREKHFQTAKEAALSLGVPYGTYTGHEAGSRGFKDEELALYARRFKVSRAWLSFGVGDASENASILQIVGRVGAGASIDFSGVNESDVSEYVEVKIALPDGMIAFEVVGESMYPKYENGDLIVCDRSGSDIASLPNNAEAAVKTKEGQYHLKKVVRTDRDGFYDLASHNASTMRNVELEWVADVEAIIPRQKWRALTQEDRRRLVKQTGQR